MGDKHQIPLDYAKPDLALRANWPAVAGIAFALVFPVAYGLVPHYFGARESTRAGIVGYHVVWAISGLVAAMLGLAGMRRSRRLHIGGWRIGLIGTILGILNLAGIPAVREYNTQRAQHWYGVSHGWTRCQINIRTIAQGIMMYASDNNGRFPDQLEDLILTQDIRAESFVCPLSNDVPAAGPTTQAIAANLTAGGHLSYVYLGKGMVNPVDPNLVVLYELPGHHAPDLDDAWFLFANGRVDRFSRRAAEKMIKQLKAGINPPKP